MAAAAVVLGAWNINVYKYIHERGRTREILYDNMLINGTAVQMLRRPKIDGLYIILWFWCARLKTAGRSEYALCRTARTAFAWQAFWLITFCILPPTLSSTRTCAYTCVRVCECAPNPGNNKLADPRRTTRPSTVLRERAEYKSLTPF